MKKENTKQTNKGANMPAEILAELERQHLKDNEHNRQKLQALAESLGASWESVKNCHIEPHTKEGRAGFFVWLMKESEHQAGKPWGVQYDYINNPADFVEGLEEMTPAQWISKRLARITAKEWKEGKASPVFKVEKLPNNRPQTLAEYINDRPALRVWFVYIHKNADTVKYYNLKWRAVVGTFEPNTKQDQCGNLAPSLFSSVNKYTNRKHCAEVYAITTPKAPADERYRKQTQRQENRPAFNYWRYKNIRIHTSTHNGKLRADEIKADQVGGACGVYLRARSYGGIVYSSEWHYNSEEEIRAELLDRSGNIINHIKNDLRRRAYALKIENQKAAAKVHEFAPDVERLNKRAEMLGQLLAEMVEEYRTNRAGENWGAFYFSHLLGKVADAMEDCGKIARKCKAKAWENIADFVRRDDDNKKTAERLAVVVAEWLNLTPEQRGHDGQEERAIYYGCYNIEGGRVVYNFQALEGRP